MYINYFGRLIINFIRVFACIYFDKMFIFITFKIQAGLLDCHNCGEKIEGTVITSNQAPQIFIPYLQRLKYVKILKINMFFTFLAANFDSLIFKYPFSKFHWIKLPFILNSYPIHITYCFLNN